MIGAYAIAVLDKNNPDEIIAARKSSPLVVGIGKDEFFLASDATPIVEYTDKVVYLQDGEIAVIRRDKTLEVVQSGQRASKSRSTYGGNESGTTGEKGIPAFHVEGDIRTTRLY